MKILEVKKLSKTFGELKVLNNISFYVEKSEIVAILGASGSGKTTLLRLLEFLDKADSGEYIFENKKYEFNNISKKDIFNIRLKTSFVFQDYNLFLNKTCLENILESLIVVRKMKRKEAIEIAKKLLNDLDMLDKKENFPSEISGGQQQRVAIARALATNPSIIFFDEPVSALDPEKIEDIKKIFKELKEKGTTLLLVTHDLDFAKNVADRIIFIDGGNIVESAGTKEFFENPKNERTKEFISKLKK